MQALTLVLDSAPFKIFFAVWTGIYLVQVIKRAPGAPTNELGWILGAFLVSWALWPRSASA